MHEAKKENFFPENFTFSGNSRSIIVCAFRRITICYFWNLSFCFTNFILENIHSQQICKNAEETPPHEINYTWWVFVLPAFIHRFVISISIYDFTSKKLLITLLCCPIPNQTMPNHQTMLLTSKIPKTPSSRYSQS